MDDAVVGQADAFPRRGDEVADDLRRLLHRLWMGAKWCAESHRGRWNADPEYRSSLERKMKELSARPGLLGEAVRFTVAVTHGWSPCCDLQAEDARRQDGYREPGIVLG